MGDGVEESKGEPIGGDDPLDQFEAELDQQTEAIAGELESKEDIEQQQAAEDAAARAGAVMAVSFAETALKMWKPYVELPKETKEALIEKGVPVVKKHNAEMPEWLQPYKEEIELASVVAMAGVSIFMQVKAYEAAKAEEEQKSGAATEMNQQSGESYAVSTGQSEFRTA